MLLIGIDEAGYGPKIGPLCHGYSALRCPDSPTPGAPDLWQLLHPSVMRHPAYSCSVTVDDSKKIYSPAQGMDLLQRGVGAFLECLATPAEVSPSDGLSNLYQRILPETDRLKVEEDAWGGPHSPVELTATAAEPPKRPRSSKNKLAPPPEPDQIPGLKDALAATGVSVLAVGARAMSAKHYNAALRQNDNKADVSWNVIVEQLTALIPLARPGELVDAVIDRQGGRKFYAGRISSLFSDAFTWIEVETPKKSVYKIDLPDRVVRISFLVEGDGASLPVALGSMAAKLARELCMHRFNAFFRSHAPNLKPTAGYHGDAHRFLRETKALRQRLGIKNKDLIRLK